MGQLLRHKITLLLRMLFIPASFFVFQSSIIAVTASPIILDQIHHTSISEVYTYDETGSSVWEENDRTGGLSRVLSEKGVRSDHEVLAGVVREAAKGGEIVIERSVGAATRSFTRHLWKLTDEGASSIATNKTWGKFYKSASDGTWWTIDRYGHGGSAFKVFRETPIGLEWMRDANKYGDYILGKHKGSTGTFISWGQLNMIR